MTTTHDDHYPLDSILFLEALWGDGFLSPGGPEEVERLLSGLDVEGRTVVDIGSGAGGIPVLLAGRYGAASVIGLDVEATVVAHARAKAERAGLQDRIEIRRVEPGPMPLPDAGVDIVFSKDSIVHIPDKEALAADAFRVLKPDGWFVASDWLISHDGEPSPEMADYLAKEDLDFGMASPGALPPCARGGGIRRRLADQPESVVPDGCARGAGTAGRCGEGRLPDSHGRGGTECPGRDLARDGHRA